MKKKNKKTSNDDLQSKQLNQQQPIVIDNTPLVEFDIDVANRSISNIQFRSQSNIDQGNPRQQQHINDKTIIEKINNIWLNIGNKKINLKYAIIGYQMPEGNPIYDYNRLVNSLITYGYDYRSSAGWIQQFIELQDKSPIKDANAIVMIQKDDLDINENINPIL